MALFFVIVAGAKVWDMPDDPGLWRVETAFALEDGLSRHDAGWYAGISGGGYFYDTERASSVAFFPAYPLSVRALTKAIGTDKFYLLGEILSNVLLLLGALLTFRLALAFGESRDVALLAVTLLCFQPATVFMSAPYTESMFMLFAVASLLSAKKGHWIMAGVFGMLCSSTRIVGVMLAPAIGLMWLAQNGVTWRSFVSKSAALEMRSLFVSRRSWLWVLLIPCGILSYMLFLHLRFGDALAFLHTQKYWGQNIKGFWEVIPHDVWSLISLHADWRMVINTSSCLLFIALGVGVWRRYGAGPGVFCLACVLIPATSTTISMVRFVSVLVPSIIILARYLDRWRMGHAAVGASALLAGYYALCYSHWLFVA